MSGQILSQIGYRDPSNEWFDLENLGNVDFFQLENDLSPSTSLSQTELGTTVEIENGVDSTSASCVQPMPYLQIPFSDISSCETGMHDSSQIPMDILLEPSFDYDFEFKSTVLLPDAGYPITPSLLTLQHPTQSCDSFSVPPLTLRDLVEARAAADPRCLSRKEKLREASIAIHLQRLMDEAAAEIDFSSDSNTSFSSPCWSDFVTESVFSHSATTDFSSASVSPSIDPSSHISLAPEMEPSSGLREIVLDSNMNTIIDSRKKQKPRSQAQKESYIKVRKHGACEKHRRQHKKCNCLDKGLNSNAVVPSHPSPLIQSIPQAQSFEMIQTARAKSSSTAHQPKQRTRSTALEGGLHSKPEHPGDGKHRQLSGTISHRPGSRQTSCPTRPSLPPTSGHWQAQSLSVVFAVVSTPAVHCPCDGASLSPCAYGGCCGTVSKLQLTERYTRVFQDGAPPSATIQALSRRRFAALGLGTIILLLLGVVEAFATSQSLALAAFWSVSVSVAFRAIPLLLQRAAVFFKSFRTARTLTALSQII